MARQRCRSAAGMAAHASPVARAAQRAHASWRCAGVASCRYAAAVPAPRGQIYLQLPGGAPALVTDSTDITPVLPPDPAELACRIARIAALSSSLARPAPLYIKPADAAPARDAAPLILS